MIPKKYSISLIVNSGANASSYNIVRLYNLKKTLTNPRHVAHSLSTYTVPLGSRGLTKDEYFS